MSLVRVRGYCCALMVYRDTDLEVHVLLCTAVVIAWTIFSRRLGVHRRFPRRKSGLTAGVRTPGAKKRKYHDYGLR